MRWAHPFSFASHPPPPDAGGVQRMGKGHRPRRASSASSVWWGGVFLPCPPWHRPSTPSPPPPWASASKKTRHLPWWGARRYSCGRLPMHRACACSLRRVSPRPPSSSDPSRTRTDTTEGVLVPFHSLFVGPQWVAVKARGAPSPLPPHAAAYFASLWCFPVASGPPVTPRTSVVGEGRGAWRPNEGRPPPLLPSTHAVGQAVTDVDRHRKKKTRQTARRRTGEEIKAPPERGWGETTTLPCCLAFRVE